MDTCELILLIMMSCCGVLGMLFNGALLLVNLANSRLFTQPDYCWFVLALSACNFVYTFDIAVLEVWALLDPDVDARHFLCQMAGFLVMICGVADVILQMLLSVNRFMVLLFPNRAQQCFTPLKCLAMVFGAVFCAVLCASSFTLWNDYGHFMKSCAPVFNEIPPWRLVLFCYGPINLAYAVSIFCAYKTSRFISRNSQSPIFTKYQIDEAKSIIIFIFLEISIPTILQTPIALMSFFPQFMKGHFSEELLTLAITLYPAHATTDPILSALVIKPYRIRFLGWIKRRFGAQVSVVDNNVDQEMVNYH